MRSTISMQLSRAGDLARLAISLTVLSVNYIGDGLRDALDPRIRGSFSLPMP
jgi:hypothetical protein